MVILANYYFEDIMQTTKLAAQRYEFIQNIMALSDTQFQLVAIAMEKLLEGEDTLVKQLELRRIFDNQEQVERIDNVIDILEGDE